MIIGSTKETINNECRVALTPAMVKSYIKFGFKVVIESNLGQKSFISNEDYQTAGAEILSSDLEVFQKSNILINVNPPSDEQIGNIKEGTLLISFLQTTKETKTVQKLVNRLTRRIENKLVIEQAAVIAALKADSYNNPDFGKEIAKYLE
mgnify:CR=1 FL=1